MNKSVIVLICICILFSFCKKKQNDKEKIEAYIAANSLTGQFTSSGLYYTVDVAGTGGNPTLNNIVKVEYTGYLLDGTKFDGTQAGTPIEFPLSQVILGWQEGIPKYQKGGKGKLIIPSALAYGSSKAGSIPANSVLVFDVSLIDWR